MPSFRRRTVATPFASAPISAAAPAHSLLTLLDEYEEVPNCDTNLRPHKRKVVDIEETPSTVDMLEGELMVLETVAIHIVENIVATSKATQPEVTDSDVIVCPEEEGVMEEAIGDDSAPKGHEEASSSRPAWEASPANGDKGKGIANDGDESGSDMDPDDLMMIDEGTTQIKIRT